MCTCVRTAHDLTNIIIRIYSKFFFVRIYLQSIWSSDGRYLSTYLSATLMAPSMRSAAYADNGLSKTADPICFTELARFNTGCTFRKELNDLAHVRSVFGIKSSITKWSDIYSLVLLSIYTAKIEKRERKVERRNKTTQRRLDSCAMLRYTDKGGWNQIFSYQRIFFFCFVVQLLVLIIIIFVKTNQKVQIEWTKRN